MFRLQTSSLDYTHTGTRYNGVPWDSIRDSVVSPAESIVWNATLSQGSKDALRLRLWILCKPRCGKGNPIFEARTVSFGGGSLSFGQFLRR